jgi:hypothetical protein
MHLSPTPRITSRLGLEANFAAVNNLTDDEATTELTARSCRFIRGSSPMDLGDVRSYTNQPTLARAAVEWKSTPDLLFASQYSSNGMTRAGIAERPYNESPGQPGE